MRHYKRYTIYAIFLACMGWLIAACGIVSSTLSKPTPTLTPSPTITVTPIPTEAPTPTPVPPTAVLLAPPGADEAMMNSLQTVLNEVITSSGLRWQVRQTLEADDLTPALRLVVALPPDPGITGMAASAPDTQFLALGILSLEPAPNLAVIGTPGDRPDQLGFIAGVIASMVSPDWRTGVISLSDTIDGRSARTGFLNGAVYICGLCLPAHPPVYDYPLYIELPSTASTAEWQEAANYMIDHYAETVYVYPGAGDDAMLAILAGAGVNIISSGEPPEAVASNWVVSLDTDPLPLIQELVGGFLNGSLPEGERLSVPIQFTHINPELFTHGKQVLAEQTLADLQDGYIDTGVDLTSGEYRP